MKTTKRVFTGLTAGAVAISMLAGSFQLTRAEEARTKEVVQAEITKLEKELGLSEGYVLKAKLAEAENDLNVKSFALKEAEKALKNAQESIEKKVENAEKTKATAEGLEKAVYDAKEAFTKAQETLNTKAKEVAAAEEEVDKISKAGGVITDTMKKEAEELVKLYNKAKEDLAEKDEALSKAKDKLRKSLTDSEDYRKLEQAVKEAQEAEAAAKKLVNDLSTLETLIRELRGGKPAPKPEEKKGPVQKGIPQKGGGAASKIKTGV